MRVLVIVMAPFEAAIPFGGFSGLLKWNLRHAKQKQPHLYPPSLNDIDKELKFEEIKPCLQKTNFVAARSMLPSKSKLVQDKIGAIVLSGGLSMVSDREPWSEATAAWLREDAIQSKTPILGICYGHQLISHALGGEVQYSKHGPQIGIRQAKWLTENNEDLKNDPVCSPLAADKNSSSFDILSIHHQAISKLPEGAKVFAASEFEPYQVVKFLDNVYSVQFHGEYSTDYCKCRFDEKFAKELNMNDEHLEKNLDGKFDTGHSALILARFLDHALQLEEENSKKNKEVLEGEK